MAAELDDPRLALRTMTVLFASPVAHGSVHVDAPSVDLTVHLFGTAEPGWILMRNRAR